MEESGHSADSENPVNSPAPKKDTEIIVFARTPGQHNRCCLCKDKRKRRWSGENDTRKHIKNQQTERSSFELWCYGLQVKTSVNTYT